MERLTHRRARTLLDSFNFAVEGIIHVLRTQRNMRIHFLAAVAVLVAAIAIGVSKLELIALLLAIAFVFITEMFNSALEQAIDVSTTSFDPLAKLAKDIAAGAVLIATINAIAIGYLVFSGEIADRSSRLLESLRGSDCWEIRTTHEAGIESWLHPDPANRPLRLASPSASRRSVSWHCSVTNWAIDTWVIGVIETATRISRKSCWPPG